MYPPTPTKDPYTLLSNIWSSLRRAGPHWTDNATIRPDGDRHKATIQLAEAMTPACWKAASNYIRRYARASHWSVSGLRQKRGYVEMELKYSPPVPKKPKAHSGQGQHREQQKNPQEAPADQAPVQSRCTASTN